MKKRHTPEQIVRKLRQAETELAAGGVWVCPCLHGLFAFKPQHLLPFYLPRTLSD